MDIITATKSNFKIFCKWLQPDLELSRHHLQMIDALQRAFEGKNKRLIVVCPPQRGKSTFNSIFFPSFVLANDPDKRIIVASYGNELALKFTRDCKALINSERFLALSPKTKFKKDLQRSDYFSFEGSRGYYKATSIGGALTGFSADYLIMDDPFKDMSQALSEKYRQEVIDWFNTVALTRLSPKGVVIITNTRWHEMDLVGKLLEKNSDEWEVVHIKAIEDDGSVCWEERYTVEDYEKIRNEVGVAEFNALYQGTPRGIGEATFDINNFRFYDEREVPNIQWMRSWDIAITNNSRSDYSACSLIGIDREGDVYVKNVQRYKLPFNQLMDKIEQVAWADGNDTHILIEAVAVGISAYEEIRRRLDGFVVRKSENSHLKKVQKAMIFAARLELQKVRLLKNQNWHQAFFDECLSFPSGAHDDMVDAVSNGINYMAKRNGTFVETQTYQPGTLEYYDALLQTQNQPKSRRKSLKRI